MVRITTNGSLFNYRYNLSKNTNSLNNAMTKVMTGRNFSTYAADPAAATRAFKIHSSLNSVNAQYSNNKTVLSKYESAWSNIEGILDDLSNKLGDVPALGGLNGTNLDDLDTQAQVLRSGAEAIIQSMNTQYDEDYIFAGSDNKEAPFAIDKDGFITYRGIQIDNPATLTQDYTGPDGKAVTNPDTGKNYTNAEMLQKWAEDDHLYVDIGLGFEQDDATGEVIDSTAFDAAISGIDIMGYGVDKDGDPKNWMFLPSIHVDLESGRYSKLREIWREDYYTICRQLKHHIETSRDGLIHTSNGVHIQVRSKDSKPYHPIYSKIYGRDVSNKNHAFYFQKQFVYDIQRMSRGA